MRHSSGTRAGALPCASRTRLVPFLVMTGCKKVAKVNPKVSSRRTRPTDGKPRDSSNSKCIKDKAAVGEQTILPNK